MDADIGMSIPPPCMTSNQLMRQKIQIATIVLFAISQSLNACLSDDEHSRKTHKEDTKEISIDLDLKPERQDIDVGTLWVSKPNRRTILLKNTTKSFLAPKEVSVSCGCVKAMISEKPVAPNECLEIEMSVHVTKDVDRLTQKVTVLFEKSELSRKEFLVNANIKSDVTLSSRTLRFSDAKTAQTLKLTIEAPGLTLENLSAESGHLIIDRVRKIDSKNFEVDVRAANAFGQATDIIRARLKDNSSNKEVVRDLLVGISGYSLHKFLPSVLQPQTLSTEKETRVILVFGGPYTPPANAIIEMSVVQNTGTTIPVKQDDYRITRVNPRVLHLFILGNPKPFEDGTTLLVTTDKKSFKLPLLSEN